MGLLAVEYCPYCGGNVVALYSDQHVFIYYQCKICGMHFKIIHLAAGER